MSIALTTHKVAAVLLALSMVFSVAFVTPASAATVEELTAQINSLLATIAGLQSQLGGLTGGTTTGTSCSAFTLSHKMGDTGGEVMAIQKFLNANGFTVATSGAGSAGQESSYFGAKTKAAVMAFQSAKGISPVAGYWGPLTRAAANSMCTGVPGVPGTPVPTGTGITVSAAAQPGNSLAPKNAVNVPFTKFVVTNNSSVAQTITGFVVERGGLSSNTSFSSVVLLDENGAQVGITKVINSNNQATVGETTVLQPGQSRTFTVAANIASSPNTGEVATFAVIAVNTTATVAGSLPIVGAQHTINNTLVIGSLTAQRGATDPGADQNKEVGTSAYKFSAIKLTAGSEERAIVKSIRFNQSGSAASSDLANVLVWVDGVSYPTVISADGKYYSAIFPAGILIDEGLSKEFVISADIIGGAGRTVTFDIYKHTDVVAVGQTYGYGLRADDGDTTAGSVTEGTYNDELTPAYPAYDVTILAGTFNAVSKSNSVPAGNIAKQVASTNLGAFTVNLAGEAVQIQTMTFDVTVDAGTTTRSITNITMVDQNGVVLAGPVDSVSSLGSGTTTTDAITFSSVTFPAGVSTITIKGQLDSDWASADTLALVTDNGNWSGVTGETTGNTITLPTFSATSNTQTVQAATLAATTLTTPVAGPVVAGEVGHVFVEGLLSAANSGEDIRVTGIGITDTTHATAVSADLDNLQIWADLDNNGTFETLINSGDNFSDTDAGDDETVTMSLDTPIIILRNNQVKFRVTADLAGNATGTAGTTTYTLDIETVTAVGLNTGGTVSVTPSGAGQAQTLQTGGTITVTVDASSPTAKLLLDDTVNQQTVGIFKFAANNVEDLDVDSILITDDGSDDVVATYYFYKGATLLGSVANNNGTAELFLADGTLTVPKNSDVLVTVKVTLRDVDGTAVSNGDTVVVTIAAAGDVDTTGKASGTAVDSTNTSVDTATHNLYEAYPTIAFDTAAIPSGDITLSANQPIARIVMTNTGNKDVTFQSGDSNIFSVQVTVVGDNTNTATETVTLKDQDGITLDTATITSASGTSQLDFDMSSVGATVGTTIPAGQSRFFTLYADTSDLEDTGDLIQVWLDDVAADVTFGINGAGAYAEGDVINKVEPYGPAFTKQGA